MSIFVFSSDNPTNLWAGVGAQLWAVSAGNQPSTTKGRITKSKKIVRGDLGLFYSSRDSAFTTPFVFITAPDFDTQNSVKNVWEGEWFFPFRIRTIGTPRSLLSRSDAQKILPSCLAGVRLEKLVSVSPTTVFSPTKLTIADWAEMIKVLAD